MNISFGIVTDGNHDERLIRVIQSIVKLGIPNYEIIVVGNAKIQIQNTRVIPFEESEMGFWITKKKNIVTEVAKYENIVYMHDYFEFDWNWFINIEKCDDFDIAVCAIQTLQGTRYRDWTLWPHNGKLIDLLVLGNRCLLPYNVRNVPQFMYISGSFWIAKREFMQKNPLDERLFAGQAEDVEWSFRVRNQAKIICIPTAVVFSLKNNPRVMSDCSWFLSRLLNLSHLKIVAWLMSIPVNVRLVQLFEATLSFLRRLKNMLNKWSIF